MGVSAQEKTGGERRCPVAGQAECLWAVTGGIHIVFVHFFTPIDICKNIYIYIYISH